MKDCCRFALRWVWLVLVFSLCALGLAQDTVTPKWNTAGGSVTNLQYSNDGNSLLFGQDGFSVWSVTKSQLLVREDLGSNVRTFNADGTKVFYAVSNGSQNVLYEYDIATRTRTKLPGVDPSIIRGLLVASRNGKWLACILNSGNDVLIYDLQTRSVRSLFHRTGTDSLAFIDNDEKLVLSGPGVYDLDGNLLYGSATGINASRIFVTPNGSMIISDSSGDLRCYRASDLQLIWSTNNAPSTMGMSRDGANLFFRAGLGTVGLRSVANGMPRSSTITYPVQAPDDSYWVIASPTSDTVLVTTNWSNAVLRCTYDPATGSGSYVNTLMKGRSQMGYFPATWKVGANFVPSIMGLEGVGEYYDPRLDPIFTVRRAATGEILFQKNLGTKRFSPDRQHYFGTNIYDDPYTIYDSATATPLFETHARLLDWPGPNTVSAYFDKTGDIGVFRWNGSTFVHDRKDVPKGALGESALYNCNYAFSPDGNRFVGVSSSNEVKIYDLVHGTVMGTITRQSSTSYWMVLRFSDQNYVSLNEMDPSTGENILRIYDVSGSSPVLKKTFSVTLPGVKYFTGLLSPSGRFAALMTVAVDGADQRAVGSVQVFRVSDGVRVRNWENQFLGLSVPGGFRQSALCFSPDDFTLTWFCSQSMVVAAVIPATLTTLNVVSQSLLSGQSTTATVSLNRVANQDTVIHVESSTAALIVPATVSVLAGKSSVNFAVKASTVVAPSSPTLSCTLTGGVVSQVVTVSPSAWVTSLTGSATDFYGNSNLGVTIRLNRVAPAGFAVTGASNAAAVTVPASISIPEGQNSVVVSLPVKKVAAEKTATITIGGQTLQVHLHPPVPAVTSVTSDKTEVTGSDMITVTIRLDMKATAGFSVAGSSNAAAITVPSSISIPEGASSYVLALAVKKVAADRTVTITIGGRTVNIALHAP